MALTDEQIRAIMQKHITCKTVLTDAENIENLIQNHLKEGWEVANKTDCGDRIKVTFRKVEKE